MNRAEKVNFVSEFSNLLSNTNFVLVTQYKGLSVEEISSLRKQAREKNTSFKVTKNSLAKRALKNTNYEKLEQLFIGPTAVAFSEDPVSAAKVLYDFSKDNEKLKIIGGAMGTKELDIDEIKKLASLPSMETIRANLVGLISSPLSNIVSLLNEPSSKIVRLINSKQQKQ
tara:strand:+ start:2020 stop:2529 length:510 start_codon:yes stop_codon:yes gene_type:complete